MLDVTWREQPAAASDLDPLLAGLDERHGVLLSSGFDYPGRYTRWDIGFIDPPVMVEARGREIVLTALNERGEIPLAAFAAELAQHPEIETISRTADRVTVRVPQGPVDDAAEEERTRRPSAFSVIRALLDALPADARHLGLYGAFGYDLVRQFEDLDDRAAGEEQRDIVCYLPDRILTIDRNSGIAAQHDYEFSFEGRSTHDMPRTETPSPFRMPASDARSGRDHAPGEYAAVVEAAKPFFERGDLFETTPGQCFTEPMRRTPSAVFRSLREVNPAPFGAIMNLGDEEFLISASPEMYVRVTGRRVETCPIAGTISRGRDAVDDADQILTLLSSDKDRSELTMCTDVDRNDKSRVCVPGSVRIIGRRQIEMYSRLIHTVDHVEGTLRDEFDGLDAFATHMWAVTLTGAPKLWAMRFIDDHERSPRRWYGGAIGALLANGDVNTGITLRTAIVKNGIAEVRAGATLHYDSVPEEEERETEVKASALLDVLRADPDARETEPASPDLEGVAERVLLLDHEDSFVQTLAGYFREAGAEVRTIRVRKGGLPAGVLQRELDRFDPTLVVMSPGPGTPSDFRSADLLTVLAERRVPTFGVCLGHQAMGEFFGGELGRLDAPLHGKERDVEVVGEGFLDSMPKRFATGRYHSLYVSPKNWPSDLVLVASDDDGIPMALQHRELPFYGVQFHPESLMQLRDESGMRLIELVMRAAKAHTQWGSPVSS